jgi:AraC-like DNA-binding protein
MPLEPSDRPVYTEIAPSPALAPWVECYWMIRTSGIRTAPNRVLPDGCSDIILGVPDIAGPVAVGTMRSATLFPLRNDVELFGIRFHPGAGLPVFGVPLGEITDQRVPLDALWPDGATRLADLAPETRVPEIDRLLTRRIHRWTHNAGDDAQLTARAVALLRQSRGGATIRAVAAALGVGERRLERAFDRSVGIGPKMLERVLRMRRAVRRIGRLRDSGKPLAWTDVAFDAGYADQPHLIREFRALAGVTPRQYLAEQGGVGFVQYDGAESV